MPARPTIGGIQQAILPIRSIRHFGKKTVRYGKEAPEGTGKQIFVYNHLQRNHVVYSLTKTLKNNKSLAQIPFNGKKTRPTALRKDHWLPFATLTFKSPSAGFAVLQRLRELRKRHELEERPEYERWYATEEMRRIPSSDKYYAKVQKRKNKVRLGLALCDQKANTVADIAFVLSKMDAVEGHLGDAEMQEKGMGKEEMEETRRKQKEEWEELAKRHERYGLQGAQEVQVEWANIVDAEYAETWTNNVSHAEMGQIKEISEDALESEPETKEKIVA